jgi:hypothetical protein
MIAVGASCSFITPLEPACLIVYGPDATIYGLRQSGLLLDPLIYLIAIVMVPWLWLCDIKRTDLHLKARILRAFFRRRVTPACEKRSIESKTRNFWKIPGFCVFPY